MKIRALFVAAAALLCSVAANAYTAVFDWSNPTGLTPAFNAPTSQNRYGEYLDAAVFTDNDVTFTVDDSMVKELSQKARFLYGYVTQTVEMRAYANSIITVTCPQGMEIASIAFKGAKADENYLSYTGSYGSMSGNVWTATAPVSLVTLDVDATINCTRTTVTFAAAGVEDIMADDGHIPAVWYTPGGMKLSGAPHTPGLYISVDTAGKARKVSVR